MAGTSSKAGKVNTQAWQPWGISTCEVQRLGSSELEGTLKFDLFLGPCVCQVLKPLPQYSSVLYESSSPAQGITRSTIN